jgi:hypothetical protein
LQSLPAEVQKDIESVRAGCREYVGADASQSWIDPFAMGVSRVSSGDEALTLFTVSGAQAVMVSNLELCGGGCFKGASCSNRASYSITIYIRSRNTWREAHIAAAWLLLWYFIPTPPSTITMIAGFRQSALDRFARDYQQTLSTRKLPVSPSTIRQIAPTAAVIMSPTTAPRHGERYVKVRDLAACKAPSPAIYGQSRAEAYYRGELRDS